MRILGSIVAPSAALGAPLGGPNVTTPILGFYADRARSEGSPAALRRRGSQFTRPHHTGSRRAFLCSVGNPWSVGLACSSQVSARVASRAIHPNGVVRRSPVFPRQSPTTISSWLHSPISLTGLSWVSCVPSVTLQRNPSASGSGQLLPPSYARNIRLYEYSSREQNPFGYPFPIQNRTLPPFEIPSAHRSEWLVHYFSIP